MENLVLAHLFKKHNLAGTHLQGHDMHEGTLQCRCAVCFNPDGMPELNKTSNLYYDFKQKKLLANNRNCLYLRIQSCIRAIGVAF